MIPNTSDKKVEVFRPGWSGDKNLRRSMPSAQSAKVNAVLRARALILSALARECRLGYVATLDIPAGYDQKPKLRATVGRNQEKGRNQRSGMSAPKC